jgi:hypothetical protein
MLGVGAANRKTERRRNVIRHRSVGLREMLDCGVLRICRVSPSLLRHKPTCLYNSGPEANT